MALCSCLIKGDSYSPLEYFGVVRPPPSLRVGPLPPLFAQASTKKTARALKVHRSLSLSRAASRYARLESISPPLSKICTLVRFGENGSRLAFRRRDAVTRSPLTRFGRVSRRCSDSGSRPASLARAPRAASEPRVVAPCREPEKAPSLSLSLSLSLVACVFFSLSQERASEKSTQAPTCFRGWVRTPSPASRWRSGPSSPTPSSQPTSTSTSSAATETRDTPHTHTR